jgi:hypothetical protein
MAMSFLLMLKSAIMSMALECCASRGVLGVGAEALAERAGMKRGVMIDAMCPRGNGSQIYMSGTGFTVSEGGIGGHGTLILSTEPTRW